MTLITLLAFSFASVAEVPAYNARTASPSAEPGVIAAADIWPSEGEIRKIDPATRKITIKHGELKNLEMPPMTMVFQVSDSAMLDRVKPGDRVKFRAEKINGAFTIMEIEIVK